MTRDSLDRSLEGDDAADILQVALQGEHERVAVDDAGLAGQHRPGAGEIRLEPPRLLAGKVREALDAVRQPLLVDALDLGLFEIVGGDDELAASACGTPWLSQKA
jgi:hypothetical protein